MHLYHSFLLLVGYLFYSSHALAMPPFSPSLEEGKLNARDNPYDSSNGTSVSRNTRRGGDDLHCNDLKDYYVFRTPLVDRVKEFCEEAVKQGKKDKDSGAITRSYNKLSKEEFRFQMDIDSNAKPDYDGCEKALKSIIDDCSMGDKEKNPHNVKAGGTLKTKDFKYAMQPESREARGDVIHAVGGGCKCIYNAAGVKMWKFWEHGWATVDKGDTIREELHRGNCHPNDKSFRFTTLMKVKDNIEWEATVKTWDDTHKSCIQDALGKAGGPTGTNKCTGIGK